MQYGTHGSELEDLGVNFGLQSDQLSIAKLSLPDSTSKVARQIVLKNELNSASDVYNNWLLNIMLDYGRSYSVVCP